MTSKLGVYWSVMHRRPQDYDYFRRLQPSVFKIMDGGPPDYQFAKDNLPNSLVIARDWAMSEQHSDMLKDPKDTGQRHAQEWDKHQVTLGFDRAKTLILGINEPRVWEPGVPEALRLYTIALCDEATKFGLRVGAMQLSVGWPNNDGPDTPPNWEPWHGVDNAIRANNGVLVAHEYWADSGPGELWGWWGGRILKCPWQVPIVVGETGVDMFVKDGTVERHKRGWRGRLEPERYARELAEYVGRMSADERYIGCAVFASDFASQDWFSFDIEPAYQAILATPIPDVKPSTPPTKPTPAWVTAPAGARVRAQPNTDSDTLAIAPYAAAISIVGVESVPGWLAVRYGEIAGYMASRWIGLVAPEPLPAPSEPTPEPEPTVGDTWARSYAFLRKWEGGYQAIHNDRGNWTGCKVGVGELKGTNMGVSACSYPHLDIKNLARAQATEIFFNDFWKASGASALPWPGCLIVLDTAVLHGTPTAKAWLKEVGPNPYLFVARRLRSYLKADNWEFWDEAWVLRVCELLEECAK